MRHLFLLCFLLVVGCTPDDDLVVVCPDTCFTGETWQLNVGTCRAGVPSCDEDGNIVSCDGEVLSSEELCDGIDNDCNGEIDDDLEKYRPYHSKNDCNQSGVCAGTVLQCEDGQWQCQYPPEMGEEICDRLDNDCNGLVDDLPPVLTNDFCYTGPPGTALVGACLPGYLTCNSLGDMVCGDVTPREEICNGIDDDCDGFVDNVTNTYQSADIVFGVDLSGSMSHIHDLVRNAVCRYAEATGGDSDSYYFGLVGIAYPDDSWHLAQDVGTAEELCAAMMYLPAGGGSEPTITAAMAVTDPSNPIGISWRPNSKRVFIGFADEEAQARREECDLQDMEVCVEEEVYQTGEFCAESNTDVFWFVEEPDGYDEQTRLCNGRYFWLQPNAEYLVDSMNGILQDICLEDPNPSLVP